MNVARWFSFTRALEDRLASAKQQYEIDIERQREYRLALKQHYEGEIERLRQEFEKERIARLAEIDRLVADLDSERSERRYLQDRLLQRSGSPPIQEPSPGERAQIEQSEKHRPFMGGPRAMARHISDAQRQAQQVTVETEVKDFIASKTKEGGG